MVTSSTAVVVRAVIVLVFTLQCSVSAAPASVSTSYYPSTGSWDVAPDPSGNPLYVSDSSPGVWRVTSTTSVTQIAGGVSSSGFVDGVGSSARFSNPSGIACDGASFAYIADTGNNCIRTLALSSNEVRTLAGTTTTGFADGTGTSARFNGPIGIAYSSGVLFVADTGNSAIRKIVISTALVSTIASGVPNAQFLCATRGNAFLYVSTWGNVILRVAVTTGTVSTLAGSAGVSGLFNGVGAFALFNMPAAVVLNANETALYVADSHNYVVRRVDIATAAVTTVAGSGIIGRVDGPALSSQFRYIYGGKWSCNTTSSMCGLLVSDYYAGTENAIRFVALEASQNVADTRTTSQSHSTSATANERSHTSSSSRDLSMDKSLSMTLSSKLFSTTFSDPATPTTSVSVHKSHSLSASVIGGSLTWSALTAASLSLSNSRLTCLSPSVSFDNSSATRSSLSTTSIIPSSTPTVTISDTHSTVTRSHSYSAVTHSQSRSDSGCHQPLVMSLLAPDDALLMASVRPAAGNASLAEIVDLLCNSGNGSITSAALPCVNLLTTVTASSTDIDTAGQALFTPSWEVNAPTQSARLSTSQRFLCFYAFGRLSTSWTLEALSMSKNSTTNESSSFMDVEVFQTSFSNDRISGTTNASDGIGVIGVVSIVIPFTPDMGGVLTVTGLRVRCAVQQTPVTIVIHWPQKAVSKATEVTTALATTAAAALGGDVVAAASLALVSMLTCAEKPPNPGVNAYAISVFYDYGPVAIVLGNIGLAVGVGLLHYGVLLAFHKRHSRAESHLDHEEPIASSAARSSPLTEACATQAKFRFPAVTIRVTEFLMPGTTFGACVALWSLDAGRVVVALVGMVLVLCAMVGTAYLQQLHVLPQSVFEEYHGTFPTGTCLEARLLFPTGQWRPKLVRRGFGPLINSFVPRREWTRCIPLSLSLLLAVVSGVGVASSGRDCGPGPAVVGTAHIVAAVALGCGLRPYRMPSDTLLGPLGTLLFGIVCVLKSAGTASLDTVADSLTTFMAAVQCLRTACSMIVSFRESQWDRLRSADHKQKSKRGGARSTLDYFLGLLWGDGGDDGGVGDKGWDARPSSLEMDQDLELVPPKIEFADDDEAVAATRSREPSAMFVMPTLTTVDLASLQVVVNDASEMEADACDDAAVRAVEYCGIDGYFLSELSGDVSADTTTTLPLEAGSPL